MDRGCMEHGGNSTWEGAHQELMPTVEIIAGTAGAHGDPPTGLGR